ncbi:MAG: hypothetical protein Q9220_001383 [cf. Caloplaca sp. 1 TL-2023]
MRLPLPSLTPTPKKEGITTKRQKVSSWPRILIEQRVPKVSKPEVTLRSPSLTNLREKYPKETIPEKGSPKHQILPLSHLPSIAEMPKQEKTPDASPNSKSPVYDSRPREKSSVAQQKSDQSSEPGVSGLKDEEVERHDQVNPASETLKEPSPTSSKDAPDEPLPTAPDPGSLDRARGAQPSQSPVDTSKDEVTGGSTGLEDEQKDTWASRFASMLPISAFNQPDHDGTDVPQSQPSRSTSIAPGAYPDSDPAADSSLPSPGAGVEEPQPKVGQPGVEDPPSDSKKLKPRKSVSIALPSETTDVTTNNEKGEETGASKEKEDLSPLIPDDKEGYEMDAKANPRQNTMEEDEELAEHTAVDNKEAETGDHGIESDAVTPHEDADSTPHTSQPPSQQHGSLSKRASSIAPSQADTDKADASTLQDRESRAPSEADNSSMKPLLSSSPRATRTSHFSESLDDSHSAPALVKSRRESEASSKRHEDSPPIVDDLSSLSTINSSTISEAEKTDRKTPSQYPFPVVDNGKGPSQAPSSLPPPEIVVKDASEADDSLQTPAPIAPATTPVQDDSPPQRRATFVALGEESDRDGPIKLPVKRRKLYVRKARYFALRKPILNAALGRQVGGQAKQALKKLANEDSATLPGAAPSVRSLILENVDWRRSVDPGSP